MPAPYLPRAFLTAILQATTVGCHGAFRRTTGCRSVEQSVAATLYYRSEHYDDKLDGAIVTRLLFGIVDSETVGEAFAKLLGIDDRWDFNQHLVDPKKIDVAGLEKFVAEFTDYQENFAAFLILLDAGFTLHFRPKGQV
jgi:hypothetical protein